MTESSRETTGTTAAESAPAPTMSTLGELRATGAQYRTVKQELRANLVERLRSGRPSLPGIVGLEDTVVPEVERAVLAGHDFVLLGERGQGKTRLMRTLIGLLDEWTPVITGSELNEHPLRPITRASQALVAEHGDAVPISWLHRSARYAEKLATPDTSVGDLIGDVDPTKLAAGRTLGDPDTVHYGLLPRANRGLFGINELPDLAERIQVGLFNVLEERDIQIRGYNLRLPLDLLVIASANPEDYTNRGRIITPLKDRFGAEIRTHYPLTADADVALVVQEAELVAEVPVHVVRVIAALTHELRDSTSIDQRSGVSARFSVSAAEAVSAAALRRGALTGEDAPVARIGDLEPVLSSLLGKLEFEMGEEGRRPRSSSTCCGGPRWRCSGSSSAVWTSPGSPTGSPWRTPTRNSRRGRTSRRWSRPGRWYPRSDCSTRWGRCAGWPRCSPPSGSTRTPSPPVRWPRRSSSCSRACTWASGCRRTPPAVRPA